MTARPRPLAVFVSGQRYFGRAVAEMVAERGHRLVGVASPPWHGDRVDRLGDYAVNAARVPWVNSATLGAEDIPASTDVIVAAHSHAFIGAKTRARARVAVGYHPSLLPLHRGRDAVRWTVRDRDRVGGGSVYHLTNAVDGGPLAAQRHLLIPPGTDARTLWREMLCPLGVELLAAVLDDVAAGSVAYVPQDEACATWEPSWERPRLARPELPELPAPGGGGLSYRPTLVANGAGR